MGTFAKGTIAAIVVVGSLTASSAATARTLPAPDGKEAKTESLAPTAQERQTEASVEVLGGGGGVGCGVFLSAWWTLYDNGAGAIQVSWNTNGLSGTMEFTLQPGGGQTLSAPSSAGFALLDVLNTNLDPEPLGYALRPSQNYLLSAKVLMNGIKCTNLIWINPLPPPTTVAIKGGNSIWEYPTRIIKYRFHQKFPVNEPVNIPYFIPSQQWCYDFGPGLGVFCMGPTATHNVDFSGGSYPWSGTMVTYPSGIQNQDVPWTVIDDLCPENPETVVVTWIYEEDLSWDQTGLNWMFLGAPSLTATIIDDDDFRPPCFQEHPTDR